MERSNTFIIRPVGKSTAPRIIRRILNVGKWLSSRNDRGTRKPAEAQQAKTAARYAKRQSNYDRCCLCNTCLPDTPIFWDFHIPF